MGADEFNAGLIYVAVYLYEYKRGIRVEPKYKHFFVESSQWDAAIVEFCIFKSLHFRFQ